MEGCNQALEVPPIPHARLWFCLRSRDNVRLPCFWGSTIRGSLARAMKRIACVAVKNRECHTCPFIQTCNYALLFETPRPERAERYRSMSTIPHPFVIEPEDSRKLQDEHFVDFSIRVFGKAVNAWAYLVVAGKTMAATGLGVGRSRFSLECVRDQGSEGPLLYNGNDLVPQAFPSINNGINNDESKNAGSVTIEFLTPTRLVEGGKLLRRPTWSALVRSITFRMATMAYFNAGIDWDPSLIESIASEQEPHEIESDITWVPMKRYSSRQEQKVPLDGFIGKVIYEGEGVRRLFPILRFGELLHVGKGTVFGLGWIRVSERGDEK